MPIFSSRRAVGLLGYLCAFLASLVSLLCDTSTAHCGEVHPLECAEAAMQSLVTIIIDNSMAMYFMYLIFYDDYLLLERTLGP